MLYKKDDKIGEYMKKIFVFSLVMLFMFFLTGCNGVYKVKDSEYHYFDDARIDNDYGQPEIITSKSELIDYITLKNYTSIIHLQ